MKKIIRKFLILSTLASISLKGAERPNIILCMSDDQGWGDTGYNGHPRLKTPSLDLMAKEGVKFTRFYSAAAMCSPTRGSCYTGRNPYRFGITYAMKGMLEPTEITITSILKKNGYTTGHYGKWHMGTLSKTLGDQKRWGEFLNNPTRYYCPPWERDVDECFVTESKVPTWDPMIDPEDADKTYGNDYFTGEGVKESQNLKGDDSRVIMDRALPFIKRSAESSTPFLAVIWFHTPHAPVIGGDKYREPYKDLPEPEQHYYACLTAMDEQIGRLRNELDTLGIADNTMIWFCSDNGPSKQKESPRVGSAGGLKGAKLSINEGGIRVPGVMIWPGKIKPLIVDAPCVTSDYFPTILDALDIPLPSNVTYDGTSLMPFITGEKTTREKAIGFLNKDANESVWIADRYKLLITKKSTKLFDIKDDPAEKRNVAKKYPEVMTQMQKDLSSWRTGVLKDLDAVPNQK